MNSLISSCDTAETVHCGKFNRLWAQQALILDIFLEYQQYFIYIMVFISSHVKGYNMYNTYNSHTILF